MGSTLQMSNSKRQRGYLLHFAAPKKAVTRISRIEKCLPQIMEGKGLND